MKKYRPCHLTETLSLLHATQIESPFGGFITSWEEGPTIWGRVEPLAGAEGYSPRPPGGGWAPGGGVIRTLPAARYRVIVRSTVDLSQVKRLVWLTHLDDRYLELTRRPNLIQNKTYQSLTTVEINQ